MQDYLNIPIDLPRRNPLRIILIMGLTALVCLVHVSRLDSAAGPIVGFGG